MIQGKKILSDSMSILALVMITINCTIYSHMREEDVELAVPNIQKYTTDTE